MSRIDGRLVSWCHGGSHLGYGLRSISVVAATAALVLAVASCAGPSASQSTDSGGQQSGQVLGAAPPTVPPAPATNTPPPTAVPTAAPAASAPGGIKPNELGTIPILEFHVIADAEEDQYTITPDHFRGVLQELYDAGFRPISLNDLLDGRIDVPAGKSPVVLTFDDSSPGQFTFLDRGGQPVVDPNCAVGMMEAFHAAHPDFAAKATFNVLPEAAQPHKLFGQPQYEAQKLRYLADHGYEIGNHTYWHQRLDEVDDQEVQRQLALAVKEIQQDVPGYKVRAMALPLGIWPNDPALAFAGSYQGESYHNDAVLLVGSDPAPSPFSVGFDPKALERVQVFADRLDTWLDYLAKHPDERFISDGDPSTVAFPAHLQSQLDSASVGSVRIVAYPD